MKYIISLLLSIVLFTSCTKDDMICGEITGGRYDAVNNMYYLRVDNKSVWVDQVTFESYRVGDFECFSDY